jgi:hypothetical protein
MEVSMTRAPKVTAIFPAATPRPERKIIDGLSAELNKLLQTAYELGYVVTVETEAQSPLAMGNYRMRGYVRGAR